MKNYLSILAALLFAMPLMGQGEFKGTALSESINTEYDEIMPRLAENGQVLYFVRAQHPSNIRGRGGGQDVWASRRGPDGNWQPSRNLGEPINNGLHNFVGGVGENGDALFLGNAYAEQLPGVSVSRRSSEKWGAPETLALFPHDPSVSGPAGFLSLFMTPDQSTMIVSMTNGIKRDDLYVLLRLQGGGWSEPMSLGDIVNTDGIETAPFLANNGRSLFFTSTGLNEHLGGGDIYVSERLDDTWKNWSEPVNLGRSVNTPGFDGYFILDDQGETAYFVSGPTPNDLGDIYSIPVSLITALEDEDRVDTLFMDVAHNVMTPLSFVRFGVPNDANSLVTTRSLNGSGEIEILPSAPYFKYVPARGFEGQEMLEMVYCDPPQSDECLKVIVLAEVGPAQETRLPDPIFLSLRTPKGTPTRLPLPITVQDQLDLERTVQQNRNRNGKLKWNNETENEYLRYTPKTGFVGMDTVEVVVVCADANPAKCIVARVAIEVYGDPVAVVDPIVDVPEDTFPSDTMVIETPPDPPTTFLLYGKVEEDGTNKPIDHELTLYEEEGNVLVGKINPDKQGNYEIRLPTGKEYRVDVNSAFHYPLSAGVPGNQEQVERNLLLFPIPVETGQTFTLKNINFDLGKATLRPESTEELKRLHHFLRDNPKIEIMVMGHTDSQNSDEYNQKLSEDRVASVIRYLKYRGVMGYRLQGKGYGESEPVDTNDTTEGREKNRRVEFKILKK